MVSELPPPFCYLVDAIGARTGINALDDLKGAAFPAAQPFGFYSRNSQLWDLE